MNTREKTRYAPLDGRAEALGIAANEDPRLDRLRTVDYKHGARSQVLLTRP